VFCWFFYVDLSLHSQITRFNSGYVRYMLGTTD